MVTEALSYNKKRELPEEIKKELSILHELGLEDYEIDYIISLKTKEEAGLKWKD